MSVSDFLSFIKQSPSAFHAVDNIAVRLNAAGFTQLSEHKPFAIVPGGRYYVMRNHSSLIAFAVPQDDAAHFQIVSSHSDSPTFKLKQNAEETSCGQYVRLNVERYGGMIMSTWFDRPLSIAGRVIVRRDGCLKTQLVNFDRDALIIPNMPIHFNREVNDGYKYNAQTDLLPLWGDMRAQGGVKAEAARLCGAEPEDIAASDLFLYNRMDGCILGANGEYFACPRIDDLECAYASLQAFLAAKTEGHINVLAVFDNEEVGSSSKQGADSTFLTDVLSRTAGALGKNADQTCAMISSSFMVSADNAHAVHPNHPEKYDADNRTFMNGGVVIKHNANQKYTTDAVSCAIFCEICARAGVPVQHFSNRSDILGGSTLGNIANTHASMNTVDIGLAQLAMHSAYETAGSEDLDHMIRALTAFYSAGIMTSGDEFAIL